VKSKREPAAQADALKPARLFRRLAGRSGLILAASGGADSTALIVLVAKWRERPPVLVVSVDHGLRPEAAAEAKTAAENAKRLGLPFRIMKTSKRAASGNLQDWARRARYALLAEAARDAGFDTIVTAHHEDDQAETFVLRLARGSGVYGLAAIPREGYHDGIALARPLLSLSRAVLREIASKSGLPIVEDPSNSDLRFDRVRVRAAMPELAAIGLTPMRLAETAGRLSRAASALDHYAGVLLADHFEANPFGVVGGAADAFARAPEEVALRALALILRAVSGADYTPRLTSAEALRAAILALPPDDRLKRTLSGVVVSVADGRFIARREWGRKGLADAAAPAGATLLWDRRFQVEVPRIKGALSVGALGRSERRFGPTPAGRGAVQALPGLYRNGTLVAAPGSVLPADQGAPLKPLAVHCIVGQKLGLSAEKPIL